jgi:hypothetical protein
MVIGAREFVQYLSGKHEGYYLSDKSVSPTSNVSVSVSAPSCS